MVTLVKAKSGMLSGPPSTVIDCTFCGGCGGDDPPPPPPPPHAESISDPATNTTPCCHGVGILGEVHPQELAQVRHRRPLPGDCEHHAGGRNVLVHRSARRDHE